MSTENRFAEVYTKFKMHFYREVFRNFGDREATLTTVETFCMEVIYAMNNPTINQFAQFIQISSPNAAYKVNNLIRKGYLKKVQGEKDHREYYLHVTQKYLDYYNVSTNYLDTVWNRLNERLNEDEMKTLDHILQIMSDELMPEIPAFKNVEKKGNKHGTD